MFRTPSAEKPKIQCTAMIHITDILLPTLPLITIHDAFYKCIHKATYMPFKAFLLCMYLYNMMYLNQFSILVSNVIRYIYFHKFVILSALEKATVHFIRNSLFTAMYIIHMYILGDSLGFCGKN